MPCLSFHIASTVLSIRISTLNHSLSTLTLQLAIFLDLPKSAIKWISVCPRKASYAKRFTLWRPQSEEMSSGLHLRSVNPFLIVYMLANIRELTLSGNFGSTELSECVADTSSQSRTLMPQHVPNLVSIRLIDIDEAEFLAVFLVGIAHRIASLVIQPSEKGRTQPYYPPSVYTTLSPIIEKLSSLSSLTISLPSSKLRLIRFNH